MNLAVAELQNETQSVFEDDEEEDMSSVMVDANLRLEMGRLYQMILKHDLFGETDADPRAIKNVQREIRKRVREKNGSNAWHPPRAARNSSSCSFFPI